MVYLLYHNCEAFFGKVVVKMEKEEKKKNGREAKLDRIT